MPISQWKSMADLDPGCDYLALASSIPAARFSSTWRMFRGASQYALATTTCDQSGRPRGVGRHWHRSGLNDRPIAPLQGSRRAQRCGATSHSETLI